MPRKDHLGKPIFMETIKEELETNAEERLSETEENEERARSGNPGRGFQQVSDGS